MERKNDNYKSKKQINQERASEELISKDYHFDIMIHPKEETIEDHIRNHVVDGPRYNSTWVSVAFFLDMPKSYSSFSEFGVRRKLDINPSWLSTLSVIHAIWRTNNIYSIEPEKLDMDEYLVYGKVKMFKFSDDEKLSSLRDRKWEKANIPLIKMLDKNNYIRKEYETDEKSKRMRDYYDNIREQQLRERVAEMYFEM